jgi:hypothetical protein
LSLRTWRRVAAEERATDSSLLQDLDTQPESIAPGDMFELLVLAAAAAVLECTTREGGADSESEVDKFYRHHGVHCPSASSASGDCALGLLRILMQIRVNAVAMSTIVESSPEQANGKSNGIGKANDDNNNSSSNINANVAIVVLEQRRVGLGLFVRTAMINHSPSSNAVLQFQFEADRTQRINRRRKDSDDEGSAADGDESDDGGTRSGCRSSIGEDAPAANGAFLHTVPPTVSVVATDDISAGAEVFISYAKPSGYGEEEYACYRRKMMEQYGFDVAADEGGAGDKGKGGRGGGGRGRGAEEGGGRRGSDRTGLAENKEADGTRAAVSARAVASARAQERSRRIADHEDAQARECASTGDFTRAAVHCRRALNQLVAGTDDAPALYTAGDVELLPEYFKLAQLLFNAGPNSALEALEAVKEALTWMRGVGSAGGAKVGGSAGGAADARQEMHEELQLMKQHLLEYLAMRRVVSSTAAGTGNSSTRRPPPQAPRRKTGR